MNLDTLIEKFKQKDMAAFEKLYAMYAENIHGVINTIIRDPERSEELCQDVFIKVWNNAESYNSSKGRFFTWILNIARNTAIDELRSKTYKNQKKNLRADYIVGILEQPDENANKYDIIGLEKLLKGLKKKCSQIIELLYFKGFTQKEAAKQLDIPLGTVKTRNRNCISKIRENMNV
ncbi:RNA polymerase sigma factor [Croceivirga thetidis]|uniref:Sigma-70 family RNA polymerase sigma factor n=1 Tax=Croceivirga thetidis TaxID=2721623 RepID=A0ABX1GSV0_9FLAO|nr:sigma-70 family RNA polymerase sigma factor [Croceivirga thetidis]NKI32718.1 sigma-70 family RNA polymerase sigma factor [Croceivirga thetidis]